MRASFVLTPPEGKRLIAKGVAARPEVRRVLEAGRLLLKGGSTVSALAEELTGQPLRLIGRVCPEGLRASRRWPASPHVLLVEGGRWHNADGCVEEVIGSLGSEDLVVVSPNLFDTEGRAAMMVGSRHGGTLARYLPILASEGVPMLLPAGLDKLSPQSVPDALAACGRPTFTLTQGMAVGLVPLHGRLFTELDALETLAGIKATVIGRGGIQGAEGSTVFAVDGPADQVETIWRLVGGLRGTGLSADPDSLESCAAHGGGSCPYHLGCERSRAAAASPPAPKER